MEKVRIDAERQHYVLDHGEGCTCLGFDTAQDHTQWIADQLGQQDLAGSSEEHGTLAGYENYRRARVAWAQSPRASSTYIGPGVAPNLAKALERCRREGSQVRLMLGDPSTGTPWMEEHDVVGRIGRSTGDCKVPLLVPPRASGGPAILCDCVLAVIDWSNGDFLYRHPAYRCPQLSVDQEGTADRPWRVLHEGAVLAAFAEVRAACGYLLFMQGVPVDSRVFQ